MDFNPKHSHINDLFAELGCTIGKLGDSSKYDARFIDIADRVIALNEGGKVDRKVLSADIDLMLSMLEKEGYVRELIAVNGKIAIHDVICFPDSNVPMDRVRRRNHIKMPSILTVPFGLVKIYWGLSNHEGKCVLGSLVLFLLGLSMIIIASFDGVYHRELLWGIGATLSLLFGLGMIFIGVCVTDSNFSLIQQRYREFKCQHAK